MTEQLNITSRSLYSIPFISNSHIHYIHSVNRTHYISRLMYNHAFLTIRSAQTRLLLLITWTNPKVNDGLFYWVKLEEGKWDRGGERGRKRENNHDSQRPQGGPEGSRSRQLSNKTKVSEPLCVMLQRVSAVSNGTVRCCVPVTVWYCACLLKWVCST